jgi:hypothetical protein
MSDVFRGHREYEWVSYDRSIMFSLFPTATSVSGIDWHPPRRPAKGINNAPLAGLATRTPKGSDGYFSLPLQ